MLRIHHRTVAAVFSDIINDLVGNFEIFVFNIIRDNRKCFHMFSVVTLQPAGSQKTSGRRLKRYTLLLFTGLSVNNNYTLFIQRLMRHGYNSLRIHRNIILYIALRLFLQMEQIFNISLRPFDRRELQMQDLKAN